MLNPTVPCVIVKRGASDLYGQKADGARVNDFCDVVKLAARTRKSSVRADSSASRGTAIEETVQSVLLFGPASDIALDDHIEIAGLRLAVSGRHPRFDAAGKLDHYRIEAAAWE